jgi:hypothetical protein
MNPTSESFIPTIHESIEKKNFAFAVKMSRELASDPHHANPAYILIGYCEFQLGKFDAAADAFLQVNPSFFHPHNTNPVIVPVFSIEKAALLLAVSVVVSTASCRKLIISTLTDYLHSPCKQFLDFDSFEGIKKAVKCIESCTFGRAVLEFNQCMNDSICILFPSACETLKKQFFENQLSAYLTCVSSVSYRQLCQEFTIPEEEFHERVIGTLHKRSGLEYYVWNEETKWVEQTCISPPEKCIAELNTLNDRILELTDAANERIERMRPNRGQPRKEVSGKS